MAKRKKTSLSNKQLGTGLIIALILQYVFPAIQLKSLSWIGTLLVLLIAVYLLFIK